MRLRIEGSDGVGVNQPIRAKNGRRSLCMLVVVVAAAVVSLGACSSQETATNPETAVTAEVAQLLEDYVAAWNAYDADALRPLLTDGFMWYATNMSPEHGVSTGALSSWDVADTLLYVEGSFQFNKAQFEWVGEPIMTGVGPWLVARAWRYTEESANSPDIQGISTYTIVDEDGSLKMARAIEVAFTVK